MKEVIAHGQEGQEEVLSGTFAEVLARLHERQHTGPITVHFTQGQPRVIEVPQTPRRITLDNPARRR